MSLLPSNIEPNQQPHISNLERAINYISKGTEIGQKTLAAEAKDSRMRALVEAPNRDENLSIGAKAVNLVYLGLIAGPALVSYKFTDSIIKYFDKRTQEKALHAKNELQTGINSLFKSQLSLKAKIIECKRDIASKNKQIDEYPKITILKDDLKDLQNTLTGLNGKLTSVKAEAKEKYVKLDLEDGKLRTPPLDRDKEQLMAQRKVIEDALNNGYIGEGPDRIFIPEIDKEMQAVFQDLHQKLTLDYIKAQDREIKDYETMLKWRPLDEDQIKSLIDVHKDAKAEILKLDQAFHTNVEKKQFKVAYSNINTEIETLENSLEYEKTLLHSYNQHYDQAVEDVTSTLGQPINDELFKIQKNIEKDIEKSKAKIIDLKDQLKAKEAEQTEALKQLRNIDRPQQVLLTPHQKIDSLTRKMNELELQRDQALNTSSDGSETKAKANDSYLEKVVKDLDQVQTKLNELLTSEIEISNTKLFDIQFSEEWGRVALDLAEYENLQTKLWSIRRDFDPVAVAKFNENRIKQENNAESERAQRENDGIIDIEAGIMENYHAQFEVETENTRIELQKERQIADLKMDIDKLQNVIIPDKEAKILGLEILHSNPEIARNLREQYVRQRLSEQGLLKELNKELAAKKNKLELLEK